MGTVDFSSLLQEQATLQTPLQLEDQDEVIDLRVPIAVAPEVKKGILR
jgi:hypothetical protein